MENPITTEPDSTEPDKQGALSISDISQCYRIKIIN